MVLLAKQGNLVKLASGVWC